MVQRNLGYFYVLLTLDLQVKGPVKVGAVQVKLPKILNFPPPQFRQAAADALQMMLISACMNFVEFASAVGFVISSTIMKIQLDFEPHILDFFRRY